jgi:hypothetical protein
VAAALSSMEAVGQKTTIADMRNKGGGGNKHKLEQVIELLKFALSLEDEEIMKSTIESVIEILEEENGK